MRRLPDGYVSRTGRAFSEGYVTEFLLGLATQTHPVFFVGDEFPMH
jgi:hypothetical protein